VDCVPSNISLLNLIDQPFLQVADTSSTPLSEYSNYSDGQSTAPFTPNTQITTPSSMFSRKTSPPSRAASPPSPHLAPNLDSAFPPFSTISKPLNGGRITPANDMYAPLSPRPQGGAEVLQRMNTIAPGPFAGQQGRPSQTPLSNSETRSNRSRSGSTQQQFRNEQGRQHFRKPSNASSVRSQGSHYSQQSVGSQSYHRRNGSAASNRARPSEAIDKFLDELQSEPSLSPIKSPELIKSRTFPEDAEDRPKPRFIGAGLLPPPSAPHHRTEFSKWEPVEEKRPGTSAGGNSTGYGGFSALSDPAVQSSLESKPTYNPYGYDNPGPASRRSRSRTITQSAQPTPVPEFTQFERPRASPLPPGENMSLPNILRSGSPNRSPNPSRDPGVFGAARSRSRTITRPSEPMNELRPPMPAAPSFPILNRLLTDSISRSEMYHSPSDSGSSGYASTGRSTPPSSVGSSISRSGSADSLSGRHWDGGAMKAPAFLQPNDFPRPSMPAANDLYNPPESPIDPAIQKMRSPMDPAVQAGSTRISRESPPKRGPPPGMRSQQGPPPAFNRPIPSKGNCAACQQPIYGKSIKAAGGKLTGRYHKECFACKTCQAPFPTAEFYVLNNAPYCGRHYHELNGSLCRKCGLGIEGQYLQTDRREKYHAHCFSCTECRVRLTEDYFEVNGNYFCERHAFSMTRNRVPSYGMNLGVHGSNHAPEKRRTRLMMM
jgi:hypothetical protein